MYERGVTSSKTSPCLHCSPRWWSFGLVYTNCPGARGEVSASSFVSFCHGFSSHTQMLVTDYGYGWHRLAQHWLRYWQVRLCSSAEKPLCWGVSRTLRRSVPMVQENSEEVWFFLKHLLGLLSGSFSFTGSFSIIRRPGNQLETIGLGKIQKCLRGIVGSVVWQKYVW